MKIYIVFEGGGSDDIFMAAFSTKELADEYAKREGVTAVTSNTAFVTEYELDSEK